MSAQTLNAEFAAGTGKAVTVDRRGAHTYVHVDAECGRITKHTVGTWPTERMARAALPGVRACKTCR